MKKKGFLRESAIDRLNLLAPFLRMPADWEKVVPVKDRDPFALLSYRLSEARDAISLAVARVAFLEQEVKRLTAIAETAVNPEEQSVG